MELKLNRVLRIQWIHSVLIVPLWNWNVVILQVLPPNWMVLIVPLWNWNTFEVKVLRFVYDVLIVPLWNWNDWRGRFRWFGHGINCTVVELKLSEASTVPSPVILVLIVPLWNWNLFLTLTYNNEHLRINCTVVELKLKMILCGTIVSGY